MASAEVSGVPERRIRRLVSQLFAAPLASSTASGAATSASVSGAAAVSDGAQSLARERAGAAFDVRALTDLLYGGRSTVDVRASVEKQLAAEPVFASSCDDHSRKWSDMRDLTMARIVRLLELDETEQQTKNWSKFLTPAAVSDPVTAKRIVSLRRTIRHELVSNLDASVSTRMYAHFGLFAGAIRNTGTPAQAAKFEPRIASGSGGFAMTELGHGSYVQGLETTATFDIASGEFVVNSPTVTSAKWWIATVARTCVDVIVFARLIVSGKDYGVHSFLVPIRDRATFEVLPNVECGDCGPKYGRNGVDKYARTHARSARVPSAVLALTLCMYSGWILFHNARIPHDHLLSRYITVRASDGHVSRPPGSTSQSSYLPLLIGRIVIVNACTGYLRRALTIAIRYGVVRRQFPQSTAKGSGEIQLMNYRTHTHTLMPIVASQFAFHFVAEKLNAQLAIVQKQIDSPQSATPTRGGGGGNALKSLHAVSAGLKAWCTGYTMHAMERMRQLCGGNGYSLYAGFVHHIADFGVMPTFEGENTVMYLQTGRFLMQSLSAVWSGKLNSLPDAVRYLRAVPDLVPSFDEKWNVFNPSAHPKCGGSGSGRATAPSGPIDWRNPLHQLDAVSYIATRAVLYAAQKIRDASAGDAAGGAPDFLDSMNRANVEIVAAAQAHIHYTLCTTFIDAVHRMQSNTATASSATAADAKSSAPAGAASFAPVLKQFCDIFILSYLESQSGTLCSFGFVSGADADSLKSTLSAAIDGSRPHAVPITDAFALSDFVLNSSLGRADGDIYTHLLQRCRTPAHQLSTDSVLQQFLNRPPVAPFGH